MTTVKIDLDQFVTPQQAAPLIGAPNARSVYRAIKRAREAGHDEVSTTILGRFMVPRAALDTIKQYYFPYYSEAHQRVVKSWGAAGGRAKAARSRAAKR